MTASIPYGRHVSRNDIRRPILSRRAARRGWTPSDRLGLWGPVSRLRAAAWTDTQLIDTNGETIGINVGFEQLPEH